MGHHHNPMDPRDPLSPALYFTFIDGRSGGDRRGGGSPPKRGCGCVLLFVIFALLLVVGLLTER